MTDKEGGQVSLIPNLNLTETKEAEARLIEAKTVNPSTYADLSHCFNSAYRELKRHSADIGFRISKAEKLLDEARARVLLDEYPEFLKQRDLKDNAHMRDAFLSRDKEISDIIDQINTLKAMNALVDSKIKVMERTCSYMDKQMQILLRSGIDLKLHQTI